MLVAFGDEIGFADTLDEALDQVFGGDSGCRRRRRRDRRRTRETPPTDEPTDDPTAEPTGRAHGGADDGPPDRRDGRAPTSTAALQEAKQAIEDGQAALADGDFARLRRGAGAARPTARRRSALEAEAATRPSDRGARPVAGDARHQPAGAPAIWSPTWGVQVSCNHRRGVEQLGSSLGS